MIDTTPQYRLEKFINSLPISKKKLTDSLGMVASDLYKYIKSGKSVFKDFEKLEKLKALGLNLDWYIYGNGEMLLENRILLNDGTTIASNKSIDGIRKDIISVINYNKENPELIPVELPQEVTIKLYDISVSANVGGGITDINQIPYSFMPIASNYKECVAFKVTGESMIEEGIIENDIIIVNPNIKPKSNNLVVVNLNGLLLVKRIIMLENDNWELHSSKKGIEPIKKYDQDTMVYLGKVIEIKRIIRD